MKCVVLDQNQKIIYKDYRRHRSNIKEVAMQFVDDIKDHLKDIDDKDEIQVDFDTGIIFNKTKNKTYQAESFPEFIQNIIKAGGLLKSLNQR